MLPGLSSWRVLCHLCCESTRCCCAYHPRFTRSLPPTLLSSVQLLPRRAVVVEQPFIHHLNNLRQRRHDYLAGARLPGRF